MKQLKKDHEESPDWICVGEGPVGNRRWSYACDYCMIRLRAAFSTDEMDDVEPIHKSQILESLDFEDQMSQ